MSNIDKQWLQQKIADMEAARDEIPFGLDQDDSNTLAALRIALASLEAEAVAWTTGRYSQNIGYKFGEKEPDEAPCIMSIYWDFDTFRAHTDCDATALRWLEEAIKNTGAKPLYTAPPAPVSMKDHQIRELVNELRDIAVEYHGTQQLRERIARTVRAAMLQGAEPVTTDYKLRDAVEIIRNSGIAIDGDKILAERDVLNSPVIPDGWVAVPVEPTEDMIVNGFESEPDESFSDEKEWEAYDAMSGCQQAAHRAKLCWAAMISAAPKLE
ncbi:hypothetical protein [Enterobacter hormaechei]|uniref:hypothetical protein n=1 Tax=Enterobacter hormaechei TaxID=158836 RepID=UPI003315D592